MQLTFRCSLETTLMTGWSDRSSNRHLPKADSENRAVLEQPRKPASRAAQFFRASGEPGVVGAPRRRAVALRANTMPAPSGLMARGDDVDLEHVRRPAR